jgi:hypothetical protein
MNSEDQINREPEAPVGPGPTEQDAEQDLPPGYADRDEGESTGDGDTEAKTDREDGGPVAEDDAPESTGGAPGTKPDSGFESHQ